MDESDFLQYHDSLGMRELKQEAFQTALGLSKIRAQKGVDAKEAAIQALKHEHVNIYAQIGIRLPYPTPLWWLISEDALNDLNLYDYASSLIDDMATDSGLYPNYFGDAEEQTVWKAKYEIIQYEGTFTYEDAKLTNSPSLAGLFDFIGGLPYGCCEMMAVQYQGQLMTGVNIQQQDGITPPVPTQFFTGMGTDLIWNLMWLAEDGAKVMLQTSMDGEAEFKLHWYIRYNYDYKYADGSLKKWPIPGNMVSMMIRVFPNLPSGKQRSSPFVVSGNFLDTVYYTRGRVSEIVEPTGTRYFPYYRVKWRKNSRTDSTDLFLAKPSGFETYAVGDYVTIMKDAGTCRTSQTWTDDQEWQDDIWRIVPVTFYTQE